YRLAYRRFADHEALVLNHTVDDTGSGTVSGGHAAVRWYELRRTSSPWSIFQQGNYAPDASHRWQGSVALDSAGDIALGYNVSSSTRFPSIGVAGRLPTDPAGALSSETTIQEGSGSTATIFLS